MALYKEILTQQGVISKYHKITGISKFGDFLSVTVSSYTSKDYRDKEKIEQPIDPTYFATLRDRVTELYTKKNKTNEEINEYESKWNELYTLGRNVLKTKAPMSVQNTIFIVPISGDSISYNLIYSELKKTEEFYGSEDC